MDASAWFWSISVCTGRFVRQLQNRHSGVYAATISTTSYSLFLFTPVCCAQAFVSIKYENYDFETAIRFVTLQ